MNVQYTDARNVEFLGRPAVVLEGLWENDEKMAGGPFRNYTFYDKESGRIYQIDIAVYYPAGKKETFLRQLDVMARTFKTSLEVAVDDLEKEAS